MKNKSQHKDYHNPIKLLHMLSRNNPPNILVDSDENWLSFSTKRQAPSCFSVRAQEEAAWFTLP